MKRQTQISISAVLFLVGIFIWSIPFIIGIYENMPNYKAWVGLATLCLILWLSSQLYLRFAKKCIKS